MAMASGRCQRRLRLRHDRLEGIGFVHGEISKHLAVDVEPGALHAVHELRISEALLAHPGIDALDPQRAEIALLGAPVAIGIAQPLLDLLDGDAEAALGPTAIALGELQDLLVTGMRRHAAFNVRHGVSPAYTACRSARAWRRPSRG